MQASDVTETLDLARAQAGVDRVRVVHRPRLLSDNGPCYISQELACQRSFKFPPPAVIENSPTPG